MTSTKTQKTSKEQEVHKSFLPKSSFFFNVVYICICLLLLLGIASSVVIFFVHKEIFKAIAIFFTSIWGSIFLGYFVWAIYYYNISYGKTKNYWDQVFLARQKRIESDDSCEAEEGIPNSNPYKDETFGLPPGTVRGMIAFTLLFGALSLLISSLGLDGEISENSFFRDHFDFFKTAFLMMIAFYFGSRSLQYLKGRGISGSGGTGKPGKDDNNLNNGNDNNSAGSSGVSINDIRNAISQSESQNTQKKGLIPIIDAGHGGIMNIGGKEIYTTGKSKLYTFTGFEKEEDNFTIYEGEINRKIGAKLIELLDKEDIPYKDLTVTDKSNMPLQERVDRANTIYKQNKRYYFLSIHSNSMSTKTKGKGEAAHGFEIYTSTKQTQSDELATIAAKHYKSLLKQFSFREDISDGDPDKDKDFKVLRDTKCPAFLVENLFFDNHKEAKFLMSESGQEQIAKCLFEAVKEIYHLPTS